MTLSTWYNRSALALIVLAIVAYSAASGAPEFAVLAGPVVVMLWRLSCRKGSGGTSRFLLPRVVVNIMLFAVLAYALLRAQGRLEVGTIAQVVVLIQIIKIGDRRAPRDDAQILCLTVFLAIAAMLDSNTLWTGALLLVFLPLLITTVMLFQLHQGASKASDSGRGVGATGVSIAAYRRGLRWTSALATLGTLAFSLVVFVLMPRGIGENAFGNFGAPSGGRVQGFTSSVTLGAQGVLSTSPTVVFDLVVKDSGGQNIGNADTVQYMRGAVLTEYNNSKWTNTELASNKQEDTVTPGEPTRFLRARSGAVHELVVSMRGQARSDRWQYLFSELAPTQIQFLGAGRYKYDKSTYVLQRRPESGSQDYSVWSVPFEVSPPGASQIVRTPVSIESATIRQLAAEVLAASEVEPDPAVRPFDEDTRAARAIQDYLRRNFSYTLELEAPPRDVDPVEHFLFTRKRGHCEYFASAMVLMCRGVGVNARMVTGYVATEFSTTTGSYTVRESNAHAWVEVEDTGGRWRRFDPTPPADLDRIHRASPGFLGRIRHAIEAMEYAWNSSIVAFNEQTRQSLLGPTRGDDVSMLGRIERVSQRVRSGGPRLIVNALAAGMTVFLAVASLGIAVQVLVRLATRRFRPAGARPGTGARGFVDGRGTGPYRTLLRVLAKRSIGKPAWRPPLDHAAALSVIDASLAADVSLVVRSYYEERYRGRATTREALRESKQAVKRVRRFRSRGERGMGEK